MLLSLLVSLFCLLLLSPLFASALRKPLFRYDTCAAARVVIGSEKLPPRQNFNVSPGLPRRSGEVSCFGLLPAPLFGVLDRSYYRPHLTMNGRMGTTPADDPHPTSTDSTAAKQLLTSRLSG